MKLPKKFRKNIWIHVGYIVAFTMMVACGALLYSYRELERLRNDLADSQQTLQECLHQQGVWESQIESGTIRILKRNKNGDEIVETWEMSRVPKVGDIVIKGGER